MMKKCHQFHRPPMLETAAATKTYHNQIVRSGKNNQNVHSFHLMFLILIHFPSLKIEHEYCSSKLAVIEVSSHYQQPDLTAKFILFRFAHVSHINIHQNTSFHLICHHSACFINHIHQFHEDFVSEKFQR